MRVLTLGFRPSALLDVLREVLIRFGDLGEPAHWTGQLASISCIPLPSTHLALAARALLLFVRACSTSSGQLCFCCLGPRPLDSPARSHPIPCQHRGTPEQSAGAPLPLLRANDPSAARDWDPVRLRRPAVLPPSPSPKLEVGLYWRPEERRQAETAGCLLSLRSEQSAESRLSERANGTASCDSPICCECEGIAYASCIPPPSPPCSGI